MEIPEKKYDIEYFEELFCIYECCMKEVIDNNFGWDTDFQKMNISRTLLGDITYMYLIESKVVAFLNYQLNQEGAYIFVICVGVEYQGKGIGTFILEKLKGRTKPNRTDISGKILPGNEVESFYENNGFKVKKNLCDLSSNIEFTH